MNAVQREEENQ